MIIQPKVYIAKFFIGYHILSKIFPIIQRIFAVTVSLPDKIILTLKCFFCWIIPEFTNGPIRCENIFQIKVGS